jgi:hypothetical protein
MDENYKEFYRPSQDQLKKIVPKIKTDNSEVINNLTNEIVELKQEVKRLRDLLSIEIQKNKRL